MVWLVVGLGLVLVSCSRIFFSNMFFMVLTAAGLIIGVLGFSLVLGLGGGVGLGFNCLLGLGSKKLYLQGM